MSKDPPQTRSLRSVFSKLKLSHSPSSSVSSIKSPRSSSSLLSSRVNSETSLSSLSFKSKNLNPGKKVAQLGSGISGVVDLYYKKHTEEYFAVKSFRPRESYESRAEYKEMCVLEYNIVKSLSEEHQNIMKVYAFVPGLSSHQIIMEYQPYPMIKVLQTASPEIEEIMCFFRQVCEGVRFLHSNFVSHRDLKMENIILDKTCTAKIIDFGAAFNFTSERKQGSGIVGTEQLISPEALSSVHYETEANDVWSLGILLYSMINLEFPWDKARLSDRRFTQFRENPDILEEKFSSNIWVLMKKILEVDVKKRIKVSTLTKELSEFSSPHQECPKSVHDRTLRICSKRLKLPAGA